MKKTWLLILPAGAVRWASSEVEAKIKPETEVVVVAPIRLCNKIIVLLGKAFCNNLLFLPFNLVILALSQKIKGQNIVLQNSLLQVGGRRQNPQSASDNNSHHPRGRPRPQRDHWPTKTLLIKVSFLPRVSFFFIIFQKNWRPIALFLDSIEHCS